MNTRRSMLVTLVVALLCATIATPASSHTKSDTGTFGAYAHVAKAGSCTQRGRGFVSGGGLGFPVTPPEGFLQKKGYWEFDTEIDLQSELPEFFASVQHPLDLVFRACGRLAPVNATPKDALPKVNLGAACGASHGHDGWGTVELDDGAPHYRLRNLRWVVGVAGILPITGNLWVFHPDGKDGKKTVGEFFALVTVTPNSPGDPDSCASKTSNMKSGDFGANRFYLAGSFSLYKFKGTPFADTPCEKKGTEFC